MNKRKHKRLNKKSEIKKYKPDRKKERQTRQKERTK